MANELDRELLPCPFCGGPAHIEKNGFPRRNRYRHPTCDDYDCPGFVQEDGEFGGTNCDFFTDAECVEFWNERPTVLADKLAEIRAAFEPVLSLAIALRMVDCDPGQVVWRISTNGGVMREVTAQQIFDLAIAVSPSIEEEKWVKR